MTILRDGLLAHLQTEEDEVLGEVDELGTDQQSRLLRTIIPPIGFLRSRF